MGVKVSCSQGGNIMQLLIQVLQIEEDKCMHIIYAYTNYSSPQVFITSILRK